MGLRSRVQVPEESGVTLVKVCQVERRSGVNWRVKSWPGVPKELRRSRFPPICWMVKRAGNPGGP